MLLFAITFLVSNTCNVCRVCLFDLAQLILKLFWHIWSGCHTYFKSLFAPCMYTLYLNRFYHCLQKNFFSFSMFQVQKWFSEQILFATDFPVIERLNSFKIWIVWANVLVFEETLLSQLSVTVQELFEVCLVAESSACHTLLYLLLSDQTCNWYQYVRINICLQTNDESNSFEGTVLFFVVCLFAFNANFGHTLSWRNVTFSYPLAKR